MDLWDEVRGNMKLRRNRLADAARALNIEAKTHPINTVIWQSAMWGHKPSLKYIETHCEEDVITTEKVFKRLRHFSSMTKSSI